MNANTEIHFLEQLEQNLEASQDTLSVLAERGPEELRDHYRKELDTARRQRKRTRRRLEQLVHEPTADA